MRSDADLKKDRIPYLYKDTAEAPNAASESNSIRKDHRSRQTFLDSFRTHEIDLVIDIPAQGQSTPETICHPGRNAIETGVTVLDSDRYHSAADHQSWKYRY